jgi:hypothetical protein
MDNMSRLRSRDLFPSEEPVRPPGKLIGRNSDVEELASQLADGLHRILAAPRRTGKSTVCEATIAALRRKRLYTVSVSLFKYTNAAALAEALAQETLANRSALKRLVDRVRNLGSGALSGRSLTAVLRVKSELGEAVEIALEPTRRRRDPLQELSVALELPQRIAERHDRCRRVIQRGRAERGIANDRHRLPRVRRRSRLRRADGGVRVRGGRGAAADHSETHHAHRGGRLRRPGARHDPLARRRRRVLVYYQEQWQPIRTPRTSGTGCFRLVYQFHQAYGQFPFKAGVRDGQVGFPYGSGYSRAAEVTAR